MTFEDAVREAYLFGAERGNIFTYVLREPDGSYTWSYEPSPVVMRPDSDAEMVWSQMHYDPIDPVVLSAGTEEDWAEWFKINTERR